jgi:hypothetical protein
MGRWPAKLLPSWRTGTAGGVLFSTHSSRPSFLSRARSKPGGWCTSRCAPADHDRGTWPPSPPVVSRSKPPLLLANCQKILSGSPSLLDSNALRLPSGVQLALRYSPFKRQSGQPIPREIVNPELNLSGRTRRRATSPPRSRATRATDWARVQTHRYFLALAARRAEGGLSSAIFAMWTSFDGQRLALEARGVHGGRGNDRESAAIFGRIPVALAHEFASEGDDDDTRMMLRRGARGRVSPNACRTRELGRARKEQKPSLGGSVSPPHRFHRRGDRAPQSLRHEDRATRCRRPGRGRYGHPTLAPECPGVPPKAEGNEPQPARDRRRVSRSVAIAAAAVKTTTIDVRTATRAFTGRADSAGSSCAAPPSWSSSS